MSVAGDGDASVSMEPEGVTMASSISAAVYVDSQVSMSREPSVFLKVTMASSISATIYVSRLSAAVREPVIWYVSFPYGEPSVRCPVPEGVTISHHL